MEKGKKPAVKGVKADSKPAAKAASITFQYFGVRGRAHDIRLMLGDSGMEFTEKIVTFEEWPKLKPTTKFGQLPVLTDGKLTLGQSGAIARHIARKCSLYGSSIEEASRIDMVRDFMVDTREKMLRTVFLPDDTFEAEKNKFAEGLAKDLKLFEDLLKENTDKSGFFVGKKVSMADYAMYDILVNCSVYVPGCLDPVPALKEFIKKMETRPNMAKYLKSDKNKKITITPNPRLQ